MDFYIFLTLTALAVSIDSMLAGFAVGLKTKKVLLFATTVAVATLVLCTIAMIVGILLGEVLGDVVQVVGGIFLVVVGVLNWYKNPDDTPTKLDLKENVALGFAVGLDAGIANLSVCLMGHTEFWIPLVFTLMHFLTVSLGAKIATTKLTEKLKETNKISGSILILLGLIKLMT